MNIPLQQALVLAMGVWLAASGAFRVWRWEKNDRVRGQRGADPEPEIRPEAEAAPPANRPACVWPVLAQSFAAVGAAFTLWFGARLLLSPDLKMPIAVLASGLLISLLADAWVMLRGKVPSRKSHAYAALGAAGLMWIFYVQTPALGTETLAVDWPVEGRWLVAAGGRLAMMNPHHGNPPSQDYAMDWVRCDGTPSLSSTALAPVAGQVVRAAGARQPDGSGGAEGNVVVIRAENGAELTLAHLMEGSVRVREGQQVAAGEPVGRVGRTGSATVAHLHIHAQRGDRPVALRMGPRHSFFVKGDIFEAPSRR